MNPRPLDPQARILCLAWSEADRWVAATALWLQVPLVAHDRIFANVSNL
jgi:hypothetical protein